MSIGHPRTRAIPRFERRFFESGEPLMRIGNGEIGGKAAGLATAREVLDAHFAASPPRAIDVGIPQLAVITTDVFESFIERNDLHDLAMSDLPDERIAHAFQKAPLPVEVAGDLQALVEQVRRPLAVRSSSLLEDALLRPFAGVYGTKMTPNNQPDAAARFRSLIEAIKYVWSSTFFRGPKAYIRTTGKTLDDERMAVIIQEVVGTRHGDRFYPRLSGVCRSYNFYPLGTARPEEGVVSLALGLGKTIVDGGVCWSYVPSRPSHPPPFASMHDRLARTQTRFWAINMGRPPAFDPISEAEYLVEANLGDAEYDGTLDEVASTYDTEGGHLVPGTAATGPRVIDFAPLLQFKRYPLNDVVREMMEVLAQGLDSPVEIEFAMIFPGRDETARPRLGFLQVRPTVLADNEVSITDADLSGPDVFASSTHVLGNGVEDSIADIVYVRPDRFDASRTQGIAEELERHNAILQRAGRAYLLITFGRLGTSDPWLGVPVEWSQICGARTIIEATLPQMPVELSQGSHFFHNLSSFQVGYFMVSHRARPGIDWDWLTSLPVESETEHVRHVRLNRPLDVRVDGRSGRGVIRRSGARSGGAP